MATSVEGIDDGSGFGVKGTAVGGDGVVGTTRGINKAAIRGIHTGHISAIAVIGELDQGTAAVLGQVGGGAGGVGGDDVIGSGVWGNSSRGPGVSGTSSAGQGVLGEATSGDGVAGVSGSGRGVAGGSTSGIGVYGESAAPDQAGVSGLASNAEGAGAGVVGESRGLGSGVMGNSGRAAGVIGFHGDPALQESTVASFGGRAGVFGASENGAGVLGYARAAGQPAVHAFGDLRVNGNVDVSGDIFLPGADCAEEFEVVEPERIDPGTVLVIEPDGRLRDCVAAYDRTVAGVVSGAGTFRPGIILDGHRSAANRRAVALVGKVCCKIDATYGSVDVGDMLTTSATPGHAMKASDPDKSFGAIIGKALAPLAAGTGVVPILICLQ